MLQKPRNVTIASSFKFKSLRQRLQRQPKVGRISMAALETIGKLIPILATLFSAYWAYTKYEEFREGAQKLEVELKPQVTALETGLPVLVADVYLRNIGKVAIKAKNAINTTKIGDETTYFDCNGETLSNGHEGLELTIIEYKSNKSPQQLHEEQDGVIDWNESMTKNDDYAYLVRNYNMLKGGAFNDCRYVLNPAASTRESIAIPVHAGKLYAILVRFYSVTGWSERDITYIYVPMYNRTAAG